MSNPAPELIYVSAKQYEAAPLVRCMWNKQPVYVLAYSLGATAAYCMLVYDNTRLDMGDFHCRWINTAQLTQVLESES